MTSEIGELKHRIVDLETEISNLQECCNALWYTEQDNNNEALVWTDSQALKLSGDV